MNSNRDIIIKIDNVVYGGYGLGRNDGKIIFVASAIPGDVVKISIKDEYKDYSTAVIDSFIEKSPDRVTPDCPVADLCGGCSYLNISYDKELELKRKIIKDQLKRVAGLNEEELPGIQTLSDKRYGYRSHTRFNIENNIKGFFRKGTNQIIGFPDQGCLLLSDELNQSIKNLPSYRNKTELKAVSDYKGDIHFSTDNTLKEIIESENGLFYHRDINGFFQANRYLREKMIQEVLTLSHSVKKDTFMDICSGCGFFTLPLTGLYKHGHGFDIDMGSIKYAKINSKVNNIRNVNFYTLSESEIKPHLFSPDLILIDPPRSGLSKKGRRTVNAIYPPEIIYISCNPSTFSRDLKDFMKNGYRLEKLIFIDMFPCTYHIELITLLRRSEVTV